MTDEHGRKEYFDNTLGIGFDAVVTIRSHKLPLLRGFLMYLTAVIQTIILNFDPALMQMETDGSTWEQSNLLLVMCNGPREGGGFLVAPEAKIDDGMLHYAMIRKVQPLDDVPIAAGGDEGHARALQRGHPGHVQAPGCQRRPTTCTSMRTVRSTPASAAICASSDRDPPGRAESGARLAGRTGAPRQHARPAPIPAIARPRIRADRGRALGA